MKKGLFLFVGALLMMLLASCQQPAEQVTNIEIKNMVLKEDTTYFAYFDSSAINLNDYVVCNKTYEIIYKENYYKYNKRYNQCYYAHFYS